MNLPPLDLALPEVARDPYAVYRRYREIGPTHFEPPSKSSPTGRHFLLRHAHVFEGMRHPLLVRGIRQSLWEESRREIPPEHLAFARVAREFVLYQDPPKHGLLRQPINRMIQNVIQPDFRPWVAEEARRLADTLPRTGTVDLVAGYAQILVSRLIGMLFGADATCTHEEMDEMATFIQLAMGNRYDPRILSGVSARMARMEQFINGHLAAPPASLGEARLLQSILRESRLADLPANQIRSTAIFLILAARDNVRSSIANAVLCFLRHPGTWQHLRECPSALSGALDEVLRIEPSVHFVSRHAAADLEIRGCRIAAGEGVTFCLASANRDPDVFEQPDNFDIHRAPGPVATFGFGIHRCPGIALAKVLVEEALKALLAQWRNPTLADSPEHLVWQPSSLFRMAQALVIRAG